MTHRSRQQLQHIKDFAQLIPYLRDELDWPVEEDDFDDLFFDYEPEELGIAPHNAAKIHAIRQLRPLADGQPWGIFFLEFEPKHLPVVALRRILNKLVVKKRAGSSEQAVWQLHDLLFISAYGENAERQISFAHFAAAAGALPTLKVLGWDEQDTGLHLDHVHDTLRDKLRWPDETDELDQWRAQWAAAFTLRHREVITTSQQLALRLAGLAHRIRARVNTALTLETERGPLRKLMTAFKKALIHDLGDDDFADMYAQTIAYGLLSARVSRPMGISTDSAADMVPVTNPFLKELMDTFLNLGGRKQGLDFDELGVNDVVDLLNLADMEAVLRDFGNRNPQEDPVIHFYEVFLKAYDAKKRMQRGVFYTPKPVVSFIVRGVDDLLRDDFSLADGLADTTTWGEMAARDAGLKIPDGVSPDAAFVQILDPATGTGTFLVEIIERIYATLRAKWQAEGLREASIKQRWNEYVPRHLLPRLHGFELMMAPYAIAHMKIGLKLFETGYTFGSDARARIFLTNALEPPREASVQMELGGDFAPVLAHEAEAANRVKKGTPITVVVGNPPYAGHSINKEDYAKELVDKYKKGIPELKKPAQAKWLSNDYVKFISYAENVISHVGFGLFSLITDSGYLDNATFRGMRKNLLENHNKIFVLNLLGAHKKQKENTDDENVFDIMQGVSVGFFVRSLQKHTNTLTYTLSGKRQFKYEFLFTHTITDIGFDKLGPSEPQYYLIVKELSEQSIYDEFLLVTELALDKKLLAPGIITTHDQFAISHSKNELIEKIEIFLKTETEDEARRHWKLCTQNQWNYNTAKESLLSTHWHSSIEKIFYRPFDIRWTVYDSSVAVHRRQRMTYHLIGKNNFGLMFCRQLAVDSWEHINIVTGIVEDSFVSNRTKERGYCFPLYIYSNNENHQQSLSIATTTRKPNLDPKHLKKIAENLKINFVPEAAGSVGDEIKNTPTERRDREFAPLDLLDNIYAVLHSPTYREKYKEFLKIDFPRVPWPQDPALFWRLVDLGGELRRLHLLESPVLDNFITRYPVAGDNQITRSLNKKDWELHDGDQVRLWLNDTQYFDNIPRIAWEFYIGGYQPAQKWLKDRKGRTLSAEDIAHYQKIIVALMETHRLMGVIDETWTPE